MSKRKPKKNTGVIVYHGFSGGLIFYEVRQRSEKDSKNVKTR